MVQGIKKRDGRAQIGILGCQCVKALEKIGFKLEKVGAGQISLSFLH